MSNDHPTVVILEEMAATFRERNAIYKDNFDKIDEIMNILHPEGIEASFAMQNLWHQVLGKLTRFAAADLTHKDSIHDLAVYAAMIESQMEKEGIE